MSNRSALYQQVRGGHEQRYIDYEVNGGAVSGLWPLYEPAGIRKDFSPNGNHLTDNSTVTDAPGPSIWIPRASQFTAANDEFLSVASNANLVTGLINYTLSCWVYLDTTGANYRIFISKREVGTYEYQLFYSSTADSGLIEFELGVGAGVVDVRGTTFGTPPTGQWLYIAAWVDASARTLNLQINNGVVETAALGGTDPNTGTALFQIGRDQPASPQYMDGRITQVVLEKRLLPADARTWRYNNGAGQSIQELRMGT